MFIVADCFMYGLWFNRDISFVILHEGDCARLLICCLLEALFSIHYSNYKRRRGGGRGLGPHLGTVAVFQKI